MTILERVRNLFNGAPTMTQHPAIKKSLGVPDLSGLQKSGSLYLPPEPPAPPSSLDSGEVPSGPDSGPHPIIAVQTTDSVVSTLSGPEPAVVETPAVCDHRWVCAKCNEPMVKALVMDAAVAITGLDDGNGDHAAINWDDEKLTTLPPRTSGRIAFLLRFENEIQTRDRILNDRIRYRNSVGN
jgi:hypothetical protein